MTSGGFHTDESRIVLNNDRGAVITVIIYLISFHIGFNTGLFRGPTKNWSTHQLNSVYTVAWLYIHQYYDRYKTQTWKTIVKNNKKLPKTSFLIYSKTLLQMFLKFCLQVVNPPYILWNIKKRIPTVNLDFEKIKLAWKQTKTTTVAMGTFVTKWPVKIKLWSYLIIWCNLAKFDHWLPR